MQTLLRRHLPLGPAILALAAPAALRGEETAAEFYLPENPAYTIVDSALDSVRFTLEKTLIRCSRGHLAATSTFVDPEGKPQGWHDFGNLEGPGWASNAVGGAYEIHLLGDFLGRPEWKEKSLAILDHVLDHGFIDEKTGFIRGYRDTVKDELCLNYKHNSEWFCPGSMAKVAYQLLIFADELGRDPRTGRMRRIAVACALWINENVKEMENGWFPRRVTPAGEPYARSPEGGKDKLAQTSADGLFVLQLWAGVTRRGLSDFSLEIARKTAVFASAGGLFGSINHDTYDASENVAHAVAFRTLSDIANVLQAETVRSFAYSKCLAGLERFQMREDRNGVAAKGLLYMEDSWPTAYLWENAEAALAYFEAAKNLRQSMPDVSRKHEKTGLTILRAIAKHHHGPHGFLTEGVDWSNHVGKQHHFDGKEFGDIRYTEPFLNNQHIIEPTIFYLRHLATAVNDGKHVVYKDIEGNVLHRRATQGEPAGSAPARGAGEKGAEK